MSYKELFDKIDATSSRNVKQHILEVNSGDKVLQRILEYALNPLMRFYINKKIPKYEQGDVTLTMQDALDRITALSDRKVTGNDAIKFLQDTLSHLTPDDADVILRIVKKKLGCGISVETVNMVWPNLVFKYTCLLCEKFSLKHFSKISSPFIVQTKEDGGRINAIVVGKTCRFFTRNGNQFNLSAEIEEMFIQLADGLDLVFDGELLVKDAPRQEGNGKLTKAIRGTITPQEVDLIYFTLWDVIPFKAFTQGKCLTPYETRLLFLEAKITKTPNPRIRLIHSVFCDTLEEAVKIFQDNLANDLEGIIIKDGKGIWEGKRVRYQLKMKAEKDCELLCIGTLPGEEGTKYEDCIGSLVCESGDKLLTVNVSSGMKDIDRLSEAYPGSIIWIKYNDKIQDLRTGKWSLFLPVYKGIRLDKDRPDNFEDIE